MVLFGAPLSKNHPGGFASPEPPRTAASKPSGYNMTCRGVARQGEDGRPQSPSHNSHDSHASVTPPQTAYPRCHQVALHTQRYLFAPSKTRQRHRKPTGYHMTHLSILSDTSDLSDRSDSSVTPPRHAYPRSHQVALHTLQPPATFSQQLRECSKHGICPVCNNFISPFKINFCRL